MSKPISLMQLDDHLLEEFNNELFNAKDSKVSHKDFDNNEIYVKCTTEGWIDDDGSEFPIEDEIVYRVPNGFDNPIGADFSLNREDTVSYYKFLVKNNVNPLVDYIK